jgi:outer membrane lipoprotein SlyB
MQLQSQETQRHNNVGNVALTAVGGMIVGNMIGKSLFKSSLGGPAGLIAGALYANNKKTNVSLRQGSVVVTEVRQSVALLRPRTTAQISSH